MKIAAFLMHPTIREFRFTDANAARLVGKLPHATVVVCGDRESFVGELADAEIALVWGFRQEWFAEAPNLRLISTPAAGRDYFKVDSPGGVKMLYGAFHGAIMAETALAMVAGAARGVIQGASCMSADGDAWPQNRFTSSARTVRGSHVAILGFGAIGHHAGRLLKALGARITGIRRNPEGDQPEWFGDEDRVVGVPELDNVLPDADHLLCILPSGETTVNIMDARRLALLPRGAFVHNIGRGNCIDESALASALEEGLLGGAFLDVFDTEPLPAGSPLRKVRNAYLYPHVSAVAPQYMDLYVDELAGRLASLGIGI